MAKKTFYLTTAIAYTSGKPHIGNTYEAILADSIVRFKRPPSGWSARWTTPPTAASPCRRDSSAPTPSCGCART